MLLRESIIVAAFAVSVAGCSGTDRSREVTDGTIEADNTGMNQRDLDEAMVMPMDQSESEADRTTTQNIREAVMANASLSMNAKNVKIITVNGLVTLRGPVDSAQEKQAIVDAARVIAGADRVVDQLEIAGPVSK